MTSKSFPLQFERAGERVEVSTDGNVAVNESTAHLNALLAGLGIGLNFRFQVQPYLDRGELIEVLPQWRQAGMPLYAMYPQNRHLNARTRVFVDWVAEVFGALDARVPAAELVETTYQLSSQEQTVQPKLS